MVLLRLWWLMVVVEMGEWCVVRGLLLWVRLVREKRCCGEGVGGLGAILGLIAATVSIECDSLLAIRKLTVWVEFKDVQVSVCIHAYHG